MSDIRFDTGLKTFSLNGAIEVCFNPTDVEFAQKVYDTFDSLDKKQEYYKEEVKKIAGTTKVFDFARERDAEMRTMIDGVFGCPVCDAVFGKMNVYALADGLPVWCNLMLAVIDEVSGGLSEADEQQKKRMAEYTKKYKR